MKQTRTEIQLRGRRQALNDRRQRGSWPAGQKSFWVMLCGVLVFGALVLGVVSHDNKLPASEKADLLPRQTNQRPGSLSLINLLELPTAELEHTDVALMNLLCAQRLPGAG